MFLLIYFIFSCTCIRYNEKTLYIYFLYIYFKSYEATFFTFSDIVDKLSILEEWSLSTHERAGCLLVGYEAFRTLVFYHSYKYRGSSAYSKLESIREAVNKYLLNPGK